MKTAIRILFRNPIKMVPALGALGLLNFIPDKLYLKMLYRSEMRQKLNLENPLTFNEKLQWLKIYDRNPLYTMLADKFAVRKFIKKTLGEEYLIPLIGSWSTVDAIDFNKLPQKFVLKCNHDSNSVIICRDKTRFDFKKARKKLKKRLKRNAYYGGREWPYKDIKPCVIAEEYMTDENQPELTDYKFFCFNGKAEFLYVSSGLENHQTASISFFDLKWRRLPFCRQDYREFKGDLQKPKNFEKMIQIANYYAKEIGSPFIRIDMYEINNKIFFSEFTFTPCCGMIPFYPQEWDMLIGEMLKLPV